MKTVNETLSFKLTDKMKQALKHDYLNALKDPKFESLVKKIHLPDEILMKYTSELEEASIEYDHCKHCRNLLTCKNKMLGYAYLPKVKEDYLSFHYQACRYKKEFNKEHKYLENIYCLNEPENIRNATMKDIFMDDENRFEVIKYLTNFIKTYKKNPNQKGLYLHGSFGCGKSYLISAAFHELAKQDVKSAIVFWPEFLSDLKESFATGGFHDKVETLKKVPLLLIDDIGAESTTPWSRDEIFCPIVQYRMQEHLPTFFTSNLNKQELETHFSTSKDGVEQVKARRIIERINQLTEDKEMISKNRRH